MNQIGARSKRSQLNYAHNIPGATDPKSFTDVTCAGAKTTDFFSSQAPGVPPQLDALTKRTRLVTMTIGGNDGDAFDTILHGCIAASLTSGSILGNPCEQQFGSTFTDLVADQTYPNLVQALTAVRQKAPLGTVVILGLPARHAPNGHADLLCRDADIKGRRPLRQPLGGRANNAVMKAADETGAHFVDMASASVDRNACQPTGQRWIEPVNGAINADPVHPNGAGEAAMAAQTLNHPRHRPRLTHWRCREQSAYQSAIQRAMISVATVTSRSTCLT